MAEKKNSPAGVIILIIIILAALFFIIRQAMPGRTPATEMPQGMEGLSPEAEEVLEEIPEMTEEAIETPAEE